MQIRDRLAVIKEIKRELEANMDFAVHTDLGSGRLLRAATRIYGEDDEPVLEAIGIPDPYFIEQFRLWMQYHREYEGLVQSDPDVKKEVLADRYQRILKDAKNWI